MNDDAVVGVKPLGFPWEATDPFLFCVYHLDAYPAGNDHLGPPAADLAGRNIGNDFEVRDGWRMYHGDVVPGFPQHPHRGFETVTVVRRGFVDHSDSLGAVARFGPGDVQWLTAGRGIVHSEMFPLLRREEANPLELFQIWLNLPRASKLAEPYFSMLWDDTIPTHTVRDETGRLTEVRIVAGRIADLQAPSPPPNSWAAKPDTNVAIWTIRMAPEGSWWLPHAAPGLSRTLYFFRGDSLRAGGRTIQRASIIKLASDKTLLLENGGGESEMLLLQGKPIGEPVVQYGPFVMNSREEIQQAFTDYRHTRFGGWPWPGDGPVHPRDEGRYARHADGRVDKP